MSAGQNYPTNEDAFVKAERIFKQDGDFRSANDLGKARRYVDALNTMIPLLPQQMRGGGSANQAVIYDINALLKLKDSAERWINAAETSSTGKESLIGWRQIRR